LLYRHLCCTTGIILEYELRDKTREMKEIDLLHLMPETDVDVLVNQVVFEEPLISDNRKPQLRRLIYKLIEKLESNESNDFYLFKILRAHILPLTNCAFSKSGDKFITGAAMIALAKCGTQSLVMSC
jgi:dynein assembly factor with WDR repeat domains 1